MMSSVTSSSYLAMHINPPNLFTRVVMLKNVCATLHMSGKLKALSYWLMMSNPPHRLLDSNEH